MTKKEKMGFIKRVGSMLLALTLVVTSVQISVPVQDVKAASSEGMGDTENLSATHVPDSEVRKFYTILANAQKNLEVATKKEDDEAIAAAEQVMADLDSKNAGQIVAAYGNNESYTQSVYGIYLTNYPGKIDFEGLTVTNIEGIGWARTATEFDLSTVSGVTAVPNSEFAFCKMTKIILPSTVKKIGDNAFKSCGNLKTLMIGEGAEDVVDLTKVNEVGASAFSGCAAIETVNFADYNASNELKIGSSAFASCTSLEEIEVPIKTAANLGANAFEQCTKLSEVRLHNELAYLNNGLFSGVGSATSGVVFYPIGESAPLDGKSVLPTSITYIGNNCFSSAVFAGTVDLSACRSLTKINQYGFSAGVIYEIIFPDSLETIERMAFNASKIFEEVVIPDACTMIGKGAFLDCMLFEITLPAELKVIEESTFEGCEYLMGTEIHIPDNSKLEKIETKAFKECGRLGTTSFIKNLKYLTTIEDYAFTGCYMYLAKVDGSATNNRYGEKAVITGLEEVILPNSVVTLGEGVFMDNYYLREANLGTGITNIPKETFYNKTYTGTGRLEKVIVSDKLQVIGESAFKNQGRLHTIGYTDGTNTTVKEGTVQFGNSLYLIGDYAFSSCGLMSKIPVAGVKTYALTTDVYTEPGTGRSELLVYDYESEEADANIGYCRTVYVNEDALIKEENLPNDAKDAEGNLKSTYKKLNVVAKKVYVDTSKLYEEETKVGAEGYIGLYELYDTDTTAYENRIFSLSSSMTEQGYYCAEGDVENIVSLTAGSGKTQMYIKAATSSLVSNAAVKNSTSATYNLYYPFGLKDVKIPDSVKEDNLGIGAFEKCVNLNKVTLSENLTQIKKDTFSGAGGEIVNSVSSSDKYHDYYGMRSVYIPNGMKQIGENAFKGCSNLYFAKISASALGTGLESIGKNAFSGCLSLETMKFPTSLKTIGESAFYNCALMISSDAACKREITDNSTGVAKKYTFYQNYETYGTKTIKTGLTEIDFTTAKNLETIGKSAFKQTNITSVQLTKSPLETIADSTFAQCSYLEYVTLSDNVKKVEDNALKDPLSLINVTLPVTAVLGEHFVWGAYGSVIEETDPVLSFSYVENDEIVVPVNSSLRLLLDAFNADVINGEIKVVLVDGDEEINILDNEVNGLRAEVDTSSSPYSFILHGTQYVTEPVQIKIQVGTAFDYADEASFDGVWQSNHTFTYQVTVADVPTETVSLSAETDNYVKKNPSMYTDNGTRKALYVAEGSEAAKNGVVLTAAIEPKETTDEVTWTSSNPDVVEVTPGTYTEGSGKATATVKVKSVGDATITVASGTKTDVIYVYGQVGVTGTSGFVCTTDGTILGETLKTNSSSSPYSISVGDSDKINVSINYGNTNYTEEQLKTYGEQVVITSSDESVVVVEEDGTFRAVGEGKAQITVTGQASGKKVTFYLEVTDETNYTPSAVTISGPNEVSVGETIALSAAVTPTRASQEVTWKVSSGASYASVDNKGNVTGLAKGEATIVATSAVKDSVKSTAYKVKVSVPIETLNILNQDVSLEVGKTLTLSKTTVETATKGFYVYPTNATESIAWTSSDESVLEIVNGSTSSVKIKGIKTGTATVTATTASGMKVSFTVDVIEKVTSITVTKEITLNVGGSYTLNPQKTPATANEKITYTYKSSNEKVVTVDANGVVRAIAPGKTTVSVKTNTGKSASCTVTVKSPAKKITLLLNRPSTKKIYVVKGQSISLKTKLDPVDSTDKVTFKSNKKKVATVSESGTISAKKKGTAKITVTAESGKKVTLTVYVSNKEVKAKKVTIKVKKTVKRNQTVKVGVTLKSAKSTDTLTFSVNNAKRASIDSYGYLTAKKKGKVKVTVKTSSGKKATKTVKIK